MLIQPQELVNARLYDSEEAVIQDALRSLMRSRPQMRAQIATYRYQNEQLSLAKAAEIAGVSWAQMADILREQGVPLYMGPATIDEAQAEVNVLESYLSAP